MKLFLVPPSWRQNGRSCKLYCDITEGDFIVQLAQFKVMPFLHGLVPARFLILIAHLTIVLIILWSKDEIVRQDMPLFFTESDFEKRDYNLSIGLYLSICLIAIELLTFLSGISLFWPFISFLSMTFHSIGSICLSFFIINQWQCELYWLVFAISNIIPIVSESFAVIGVLALKK